MIEERNGNGDQNDPADELPDDRPPEGPPNEFVREDYIIDIDADNEDGD